MWSHNGLQGTRLRSETVGQNIVVVLKVLKKREKKKSVESTDDREEDTL